MRERLAPSGGQTTDALRRRSRIWQVRGVGRRAAPGERRKPGSLITPPSPSEMTVPCWERIAADEGA